MSWALHLNEEVRKNLRRFPQKDQLRVNEVLIEISENPYSGDLGKLDSEENLWRRRVGAYRIKFQIKNEDKVVYIYEIKRRTSKTY